MTAAFTLPASAIAAARMMRAENPKPPSIGTYYVVMIDHGRSGREAVVNPELTKRNVVEMIASGEYSDILFIHEVADGVATDVTLELQIAASIAKAWGFLRDGFEIGGELIAAVGALVDEEDQREEARGELAEVQ